MTPVLLGHGLGIGQKLVPVAGAGGVGSVDESDAGVKFVITNYKCKFINRIHAPLCNCSAHRQPNFFCRI